jgi:hypothetical protein
MRTLLENEIWSFYGNHAQAKKVSRITEVTGDSGYFVESYLDLATKVAELQFRNPDYVLMFRGQADDYHNVRSNTSLKPSLFRSLPMQREAPDSQVLTDRFVILQKAETHLLAEYRKSGLLGFERISRHRLLRWAVLQHYEVCPTPLLDVTHSLRIAASFASDGDKQQAFIYVLAVPNLSGAITASAEAGLQIIRLASVCPPTALRPHIQEGYLLGEYPDLVNFDQKELYGHYEIDFGRRLIAKFRFNTATFWEDSTFPRIPHSALYPASDNDPLYHLTLSVKQQMNS